MYDIICLTKSISKYEAVLHTETGFSNQLGRPSSKGFVTFNWCYIFHKNVNKSAEDSETVFFID